MAFLWGFLLKKSRKSHPSCTAGVSVCPRISSGEINPEPSISISLKSRRASPTGEFRKQYEWKPKDKVKTKKKKNTPIEHQLCFVVPLILAAIQKKQYLFRFSKLSNSLSLFSFNKENIRSPNPVLAPERYAFATATPVLQTRIN